MTRRLLKKIVKRMPPTPAKFHYIFNLRDLSRVFEGLCLSTPDHFSKDISLLRLWRNECLRVFHDRLVSDIDKANACEFIRGLVERFYPDTVHEVLREPLVFGDFENAFDEVDGPRLYKEITKGYDAVKPIVEEFLDLYNAEHQVCLWLPFSLQVSTVFPFPPCDKEWVERLFWCHGVWCVNR